MLVRGACGLLALCLLGGGLARAQDFPDGTFASDAESCAKLETRTPAELGEDLDFQAISKKGLVAFQQFCDFVSIVAHSSSSWVATAFCDENGYTYPDLFSVRQKEDGRLNVTRVTDLTPTAPAEDSSIADAVEEIAESAPEEEAAESFSSFVKCNVVKP